jgi:hypothetical protein
MVMGNFAVRFFNYYFYLGQIMSHSKFSASGSSRWLNCPGSLKLEEKLLGVGYQDQGSSFAEEGTLAHALAEYCINKDFIPVIQCEGMSIKHLDFKPYHTDKSHTISKEMCNYVQEYVSYISSYLESSDLYFTEEKVNYSQFVPDGYGTVDFCIYKPKSKALHIFDLKYGQGVKVEAVDNTQGQCYALGMYYELSALYDIDTITIHIVQPRLDHFDSWEISYRDLIAFGHYAGEQATLALSDDAPLIPGEYQCKWCKVKGDCPALFKMTTNLFEDISSKSKDVITDEEKRIILDNMKVINDYMESIKKETYSRLLSGGSFEGYKLVEGKTIRQFKENAEEKLVEMLGEKAYNYKLIGIGDAEKLLTKTDASMLLNPSDPDGLILKPMGIPTLVNESDKRPAININLDKESLFTMIVPSETGD